MTHILQFGEGNFLRTFVDHYFDVLNEEGGEYGVTVVKPRPHGDLSLYARQGCRYHILLCGVENGQTVERVRQIRVIKDVFSPFEEQERFFSLARDPELALVVSNTTEAGICFSGEDTADGFAAVTFPAKLTRFLFARYEAGLPGLYILPTELIDRNADVLAEYVLRYAALWGYPTDFSRWVERENYFCNTLVDRIVSGAPRTEESRRRAETLVGAPDPLLSVGEPFGLWVIEEKGDLARYVKPGHHGVDVVLTDDVESYRERKVRILNGSHTNLVAMGLVEGKTFVSDVMEDPRTAAFVSGSMEEILPFAGGAAGRRFASDVEERFRNPFLHHALTSILLNSVSKWKVRDLPTVQDFVRRGGDLPPHLTAGFSYLMYLYRCARREPDGTFAAHLPGRTVSLSDDPAYLAYFADGGSVADFLRGDAFGDTLAALPGFIDRVCENVRHLAGGASLLTGREGR